MKVLFVTNDGVKITSANLVSHPHKEQFVAIFGKMYRIEDVFDRIEIRMKPSGKKAVDEETVCIVKEKFEGLDGQGGE